MKKKHVVVMLSMAFGLFSCNKEELTMSDNASLSFAAEPSLVKEMVPDVYAKDGCLVLKNLQVRDSIAGMLYDMTDEERVAWEKSIGFESALTHFAPYFEKYDNVASVEECEQFAKDYASVLQITRDEEGLVEVEYPFNGQGYESVVNKDGRVRVGNTLYIYKNNRRIVVHEATPEKVAKYQDAVTASDVDLVEVVYNAGVPMTRANGIADIEIDHRGYLEEGKKKYRWQLLYTYEREKDGPNVRAYSSMKLFQKVRRKRLGGWHTYKTTYHIAGDTRIKVYNGFNLNETLGGFEKTIKRESAYFTIFSVYKHVDANDTKDSQMRMTFDLKMDHRPDFVSWDVLKNAADTARQKQYRIDIKGRTIGNSSGRIIGWGKMLDY